MKIQLLVILLGGFACGWSLSEVHLKGKFYTFDKSEWGTQTNAAAVIYGHHANVNMYPKISALLK